MDRNQLFDLLEFNVQKYNTPAFIVEDPISIPHRFSKLQDIEISGFFAATLAWGQRKTIIKKSLELMELFDFAPYDFIMNHSDNDLKRLMDFKHRTFNSTDLLYVIHFFRKVYTVNDSLEWLFIPKEKDSTNVKSGLQNFYEAFISDDYFPARTAKHVSSPSKKSACKRLNMFLRWLVRRDNAGVDFGLWTRIKANQLICPCDVHVEKVARKLNLITRNQMDWMTAEELTYNLSKLDPLDPVKYDFALFGMGMHDEF